jgi:hypothetical protein
MRENVIDIDINLKFDNGYLPQKCFLITRKVFEKEFVNIHNEKRRKKIYEKYNAFCERFSKIIIKTWIDGSYTTKKVVPGDIDVAVFFDALKIDDENIIDEREKAIFNDREYVKNRYWLHLLSVPVYPKDHKNYKVTMRFTDKWRKLFFKDTKVNPPIQKGFIELFEKV